MDTSALPNAKAASAPIVNKKMKKKVPGIPPMVAAAMKAKGMA